jgi:hypothetical protein
MHWETLGGLSTCGVAYVTELLGVDAAERTRAEWGEQSPLTTDYRFRARAGRKVRLRQIASLVPSQSHHRPDDEARRLAAFASTLGFETFSIPPLLLLQPDAARAMLDYRSRVVPAARANAKLNGRRGIQFPWESGMALGEESSPGPGSGSWREDHVSLDVAMAFAQYAHATADTSFLREQAWPVLQGVVEWLASRVTSTKRGFEIHRMMGIAEREAPSNNDAFTAMAAKAVLAEAVACARALGYEVPSKWEDLAARLVVPVDRRGRVIQTHDDYRPAEEKGATPGPLAGLFPFWYPVDDDEIERATLEFYLDLAPEYVGSPMLSSLYGVWAAWLGDRQRSLDLFEDGYGRFVQDRFFQTYEYRPDRFPEQPRAGPFFANLSGFLLGLLYGLPGLHLGPGSPTTWPTRPVVLPFGWEAIEVERLWAHGRPAHVLARQGDERAQVEMR